MTRKSIQATKTCVNKIVDLISSRFNFTFDYLLMNGEVSSASKLSPEASNIIAMYYVCEHEFVMFSYVSASLQFSFIHNFFCFRYVLQLGAVSKSFIFLIIDFISMCDSSVPNEVSSVLFYDILPQYFFF